MKRRVGVIGAGKVGIALACALKRKDYEIAAVSDAGGSNVLTTAMSFLGGGPAYTESNAEVVRLSDIVVIATQDRAIPDVVGDLDRRMESFDGTVFFHTSGADPSHVLLPLQKKGGHIGSLHPLQTFPDVESAIAVLPETFIFVEGDEEALPVLEEIGGSVGFRVLKIDADHKILYHLSAVYVCNLMCALFYAAEGLMERINIEFAPFLPIIRATLDNVARKGTLHSLTGPVVRGDVKTVQAHLEALKGMPLHDEVYRALSRVAGDMSRRRGTIDGHTMEILKRVLEGDHDAEGH